ncbi:MAG: fibronectin type III domain-containing protein [Bacteroidetes bacterium]|nr:MAG: fibronectin type III domain-containing protein [Bacteroidota bacterium]
MKKISALFLLLFPVSFIQAQSTVTCDSIIQTSTCAGGNVIIPFTVSSNFNFGNTFTAQLSDNWGSFANPVNIGSSFWFTSGVIFGTIPVSANFGFLYRVRIISSNPVDTSNSSPNTLVVTQVAQLNTIFANPGDTACTGDTITLFAVNPASAYSWSTGDTTQSIQVTQSGVYSVTTTDFLTCQSTTSDTITFVSCVGIPENKNDAAFEIYPNPADDRITLKWTNKPAGDLTVRIFNIFGQDERAGKPLALPGNEYQVDISGLSGGIYFLTAENDGVRTVRKFLVK